MSSGDPKRGGTGRAGATPAYLMAPVKAFSGGRDNLDAIALTAATALLDAYERDANAAPPERLLIAAAHPFEFCGVRGDEIARGLEQALRERGVTLTVEYYARPGVYIAEASLSASATGADLLHEAALRVARGECASIGAIAIEQMRLRERDERTSILRSFIHHDEKPYGLTMPALGALLESYASARVERLPDALHRLVFQNRENASVNPRAHIRVLLETSDYNCENNTLVSDPLRLWGIAPTSSGYAGVVVTSVRPKGRAVRVAGIGQGIDRVAVSARTDLLSSRASRAAMANLPACCGLSAADIRARIAYAEIHDAFPIIEYQGLIDSGLLDAAEGVAEILDGAIAPTGRIPVNLAGGVLGGHPIGATGLGQIVELALQGLGLAERGRPWPLPHFSFALNVGGPASYNFVTLLSVSDAAGDEPAVRLTLPASLTRADFDLTTVPIADGESAGTIVAQTLLRYPPPGFPTPHEILFVETAAGRTFAVPDEPGLRVGERVRVRRHGGLVHAQSATPRRGHVDAMQRVL